jgi:hypothetical protein
MKDRLCIFEGHRLQEADVPHSNHPSHLYISYALSITMHRLVTCRFTAAVALAACAVRDRRATILGDDAHLFIWKEHTVQYTKIWGHIMEQQVEACTDSSSIATPLYAPISITIHRLSPAMPARSSRPGGLGGYPGTRAGAAA